MVATVVHFAGPLRWMNRNGAVTTILAGWAACCSGDRAERIRSDGRNTVVPRLVSCKACLKAMAKAESMKCCEYAIIVYDDRGHGCR